MATRYDLGDDLDEVLQRLAPHHGGSKPDVLRRAVGLIGYLDGEVRAGRRVALVDADGNVIRDILFS